MGRALLAETAESDEDSVLKYPLESEESDFPDFDSDESADCGP